MKLIVFVVNHLLRTDSVWIVASAQVSAAVVGLETVPVPEPPGTFSANNVFCSGKFDSLNSFLAVSKAACSSTLNI